MADTPLFLNERNMDDSDEGFDQGECFDSPHVQPQIWEDYQSIPSTLTLFGTGNWLANFLKKNPPSHVVKRLPNILKYYVNHGEDSSNKESAIRQISLILNVLEVRTTFDEDDAEIKQIIGKYLVPFVVRNLGYKNIAHEDFGILARFLKQGYVSKLQAEIQICPSILALSKNQVDKAVTIQTIWIMSQMCSLLEWDVVERVFLTRFTEMCANTEFYIRKACAEYFPNFALSVKRQTFKDVLLPVFIDLCQDGVWGVRLACASVIAVISRACTQEERKKILVPVFLNLLEDEYRFVKATAYKSLGGFIITFADANHTKLDISDHIHLANKDGVLYLPPGFHQFYQRLEGDEPENYIESSFREIKILDFNDEFISPTKPRGFAKNLDAPDIPNDENWPLPPQDTELSGLINDKSDVICGDLLDDLPNILTRTPTNVNNIASENVEPIDNKQENTVEDNKTDQSRIDNIDIILDKLLIEKNEVNSNSTEATSDNIETSEKVINNLERKNTTDEDDNLLLYNSYNYWYISPELPLDPHVIYGNKSVENKYITSDSCILQNSDSIVSPSENETKSNSGVPTILQRNCAGKIKFKNVLFTKSEEKPTQEIVPSELIEHYLFMTNPSMSLLRVDDSIITYCAYSLPAVALTLGASNWHLLKSTVETLAGNLKYQIRFVVASSLHELALILGPEMTSTSLLPIFDDFLKDLNEVKIGVLSHFAEFFKVLTPAKRNLYLPKLYNFLNDYDHNWRFREEFAKQLLLSLNLFRPTDVSKYIGIIGQDLLCDKVAAVRQAALLLVNGVINYISPEHSITAHLLIKLAERFAHSKNWKLRQIFALLCTQLLASSTLRPEQFATEVMPHLIDLSWDPVANVRLVVSRAVSQQLISNDYFAEPANQHCDTLDNVLRRLQADKDRDVREAAMISQPIS